MRGRIIYGKKCTIYMVDGVEVTPEEFDRLFPSAPVVDIPGGHSPACWPQISEFLAVHPDQITEATADAKAKGVPTNFDSQGRPILTDRGHRKAYHRAYGIHDRSGGYGDA